jgi:RNA polymerase sigma-70 factor (ECF subfamily)
VRDTLAAAIPGNLCLHFFNRFTIVSGRKYSGIHSNIVTLISVTEPGDEELAMRHYAPLYRFALSLTQTEAKAMDLVQQTFYLWAAKGHQLRDASRLKGWLFTTLYREYLATRRLESRYPQVSLEVLDNEPAAATAETVERLDAKVVLSALSRVDDVFRAPLALFYLEGLSYKQISQMLQIPTGTVMSRLSRGRDQLRQMLAREFDVAANKNSTPIPLRPQTPS